MMSVVRDPGWFIIVNPASGGGRARRRWPALAAALRSRDIPHRAVMTESPGHATVLAAAAIRAGARKLLAVGGDGVFHELVNGIAMQTTIPAADLVTCVAPFGSGNDWARNLQVPRDPARLADAMSAGRTRRVDLGLASCIGADGATERRVAFHNVAGAGLDAAVLRRVATGGPRFLAYPLALALALCSFRAPRFTIQADGEELAGPFLAVIAALGPECGGGMRIAPAARVDDGVLDLVILSDLPLWRIAALAPGLYSGKAAADAAIRTIRCRSVQLRADRPCEVQADGELLGYTPLTLQLLPLALTVLDCDRGDRRS